jgi:hypothetical protein
MTAILMVLGGAGAWTLMYRQLYRALDRQLMADAADPMHAAAGVLVEIRGADGEMLYRSAALGEGVIAGPVAAREGMGTAALSDRLHDGSPVRRLSRRAEVAGKPAVVRVAREEAALRRRLRYAAWTVAAVLAVALIVAVQALTRDYPLQ